MARGFFACVLLAIFRACPELLVDCLADLLTDYSHGNKENNMNIRTNNHARPLLGFYDLSEKEQAEVGSAYDIEGAQFVRYKGWVYAMDDFVGTTAPELEGWHGVCPDSYFSGVLVRLDNDGETVQMGTYIC